MNPPEREAWLRAATRSTTTSAPPFTTSSPAGNAEWALRLAGGALPILGAARAPHRRARDAGPRARDARGAGADPRCGHARSTRRRARGPPGRHRRGRDAAARPATSIASSATPKGVATTMVAMAWQAQRRGRYAEATALFGETVSLWQQLGDATAADLARSNMATPRRLEGDFDLARSLLEHVAARRRRPAATFAAWPPRSTASAISRHRRATTTRRGGYHHHSLASYRQIGDRWGIAGVLDGPGAASISARATMPRRTRSLTEALQAFRELGHQRGVARQLEALSWCASLPVTRRRAVVLASAAAAIRQRIGAPPKRAEAEKIDETLALARGRMTPSLRRRPGARRARPRSIDPRRRSGARGRRRVQAYLFGSISRRTAETGSPARRACARAREWRLRRARDRRNRFDRR